MKKLNKKGFTLVELLAVIAILALLIMILMPTILTLYNDGRKQAFMVQTQNVIRTAGAQYVSEQIGGTHPGPYCRSVANKDEEQDSEECGTKLTGLGDTSVYYYVKLNSSGEIIDIKVTNGAFKFEKSSDKGISTKIDLKTDIKVAEDEFKLTCTGASCTLEGKAEGEE